MVAYRKKSELYFAQLTGSTWSAVLIDKNTSQGSLVLNPLGEPSIAYIAGGSTGKKGTPAGLKLAQRSGSTWTAEMVDSQGGSFPFLAYDLNGNPAIAYQPPSNNAIKLARKIGGSWNLQVVESGGTNWGRYASVAFNPVTGHPAVYHGSVTFNMPAQAAKRFVQWDGSAWVAEAVVSTQGGTTSAYGGMLAYDPGGDPIVCYQFVTGSASNQTIRFARRTGGAWVTTDIVQSTSLGPSDISLGFNGAPSLAFRANGQFQYARFEGP
jgi:hypothetical protein